MAYNDYHESTADVAQGSYYKQSDSRLPERGTYTKARMSFHDSSGFVTHMLILLAPGTEELHSLMSLARKKREAKSNIPVYDIVSRAAFPPAGVEPTLKHINDGPRGGTWVLAKGKEEVVACLVDELEELRLERSKQSKGKTQDLGGWEVIGMGAGDWKGSIFLIHPCGEGAPTSVEGNLKAMTLKGPANTRAAPRPGAGGSKKGWFGKVRENLDL